jgi:hypothetical protein
MINKYFTILTSLALTAGLYTNVAKANPLEETLTGSKTQCSPVQINLERDGKKWSDEVCLPKGVKVLVKDDWALFYGKKDLICLLDDSILDKLEIRYESSNFLGIKLPCNSLFDHQVQPFNKGGLQEFLTRNYCSTVRSKR